MNPSQKSLPNKHPLSHSGLGRFGRQNAQRTLIFAVLTVASCGLGYELVSAALSTHLLGNSVLQFSSIIGTHLFAMGVGSHFSKYLKDPSLLWAFIQIELCLSILGGVSALALLMLFSYAPGAFASCLYVVVFLVGALVGMEIPIVMRMLGMWDVKLSDLISQVLTFDYIGALAVSLIFPLVLAPSLGMVSTAALFGSLNLIVAVGSLYVFWPELSASELKLKQGWGMRSDAMSASQRWVLFQVAVCTAFLAFIWSESPILTKQANAAYFGNKVVFSTTTRYQSLVITRHKDDIRLHLNGNLQFSSKDEHRYHESLIHPLLQASPNAKSVLVLGGGDGLAVREILKHPQVERVVLVDLDEQVTQLFGSNPILTALNDNALNDPKVRIVNADAASWLRDTDEMFDAAVLDFPDPHVPELGKLYSDSFYELLSHKIAAAGAFVVQSTSVYHTPDAFAGIGATLKAAGWQAEPYKVTVPSFGIWGFYIAHKGHWRWPRAYAVSTRYLSEKAHAEMQYFSPDIRPDIEHASVNTIENQALVRNFNKNVSDNLPQMRY